jgi:hypothetical protein
MTIPAHDLLFRLLYGLGMACGVALFWLVLLLAFGVLRLPRPGDESALNVVSALLTISLFFAMGYGGGRLTVLLVQRWVRATCPRCGKPEVVVVFLTLRTGRHRCRACGYAHLSLGESRRMPTRVSQVAGRIG